MKQYIVEKCDEGQTLIKYLQRKLTDAPVSFFYKMMRKKNIVFNGNKKVTGKETVKCGDEVKLFVSDETIFLFTDKNSIDLSQYQNAYSKWGTPSLIYEDENLLLINKPVGILSQKASESDLSINEWIIGYLLSEKKLTEDSLKSFMPSICNRLDRNTGGIMIFAKTLYGANFINPIIKNHLVHKFYYTVVSGHFSEPVSDISYISKDSDLNKVTVRKEFAYGYSRIETNFKPLKYNSDSDITLLEVELLTGKTHQIRSTLEFLGYPVIGDCKYGSKYTGEVLKKFNHIGQILYSYKLVFDSFDDYPSLSKKTFEIKMPDIIKELMGD